MPAITPLTGLATGLDTGNLINGLLAIDKQRIGNIERRKTTFADRLTAFKGIEARLLAFQGQITRLGRVQNNVFDAKQITSSHEDLVTATASSRATPGVYSLQINSLARVEQIASQGFASQSSAITEGTLQIQVGSGATTTIVIDSANNTLQGLVDAINNSGAEVSATLIHDGSDSRTQPFRLLLTASKAGTENAIAITNNLATSAGEAVRPVFASNYVGQAVVGSNFTGTSTPTANTGEGGYTGTSNNTYTFTVVTGGTVGTDSGIEVSYTDRTGQQSGSVTVGAADVDRLLDVAEGIQVQFNSGTLVAGESFTVDVFVPTVQQAANASVTLGSGSGALTVESGSNQIDNLIQGVTLDLRGADSGKQISITVKNDTNEIRQAIVDFVESYNDILAYVEEQTRFDPATKVAGILLGNRSATSVVDELRAVVGAAVKGVSPAVSHLGVLGITTNSQGQLDINSAKLDSALGGQQTGVSLPDIRRLFAFSGVSTNGAVQFVTGSVRTRTGIVEVDISQAATQGGLTGANDLAATTLIDTSNQTLQVTIDGKTSGNINLSEGTYTRLALVQEVQGQINANSELAGTSVTVSLEGNKLRITSRSYGRNSEVNVVSGAALATLGFAGGERAVGQDVVGRFLVDGVVEPAVGTGQFLAGNTSNATTADLQVRVTLGETQVQAGAEAQLTVTRGIASQLDVLFHRLLDPVNGRVKTVNDTFQRNIDELQGSIGKQTQILEARRQSLLKQFVALETTVSQLRTTSDFLTAQLAGLVSFQK